MTLITPDAEDLGLEELLGSVQNQIRDLRNDLEALTEGTGTGGKFEAGIAKDGLGRMKTLVSQCTGLEKYLAECRQKQRGIVQGGCAFDLDAARSEIGGALDRIRAARDARAVSE